MYPAKTYSSLEYILWRTLSCIDCGYQIWNQVVETRHLGGFALAFCCRRPLVVDVSNDLDFGAGRLYQAYARKLRSDSAVECRMPWGVYIFDEGRAS